MSVWCDLRKRSSGEVTRREDTISFDKPGPDYVVYDMNDFKKTFEEIKKQHKKLDKEIKKLTGILKRDFNV